MSSRRAPFPIKNSARKRPYVKVTSKNILQGRCLIYSVNSTTTTTTTTTITTTAATTTTTTSYLSFLLK